MKQGIKSLIKPVPFVKGLNEQLRKRGAYPAGHYYSPVPSRADVLSYLRARTEAPTELPGIDLTTRHQRDVLEDYIGFYQDLPFPERKAPTHRYYFDNGWFGDFDARFLYAFLRKHLPKRIIEVGSEFSSAVMLDTVDGYFSQAPKITFIEPYPDRLIGLFREGDRERVRLIDQKIQDVPLDTLRALESGDLLFIDSSHVLKCGSDLQFLLFEILPRLRPGVFVHFHDVFYPSDYPDEWFVQGRILERKLFSKSRPFIQCRVAHRVFQHLCISSSAISSRTRCLSAPEILGGVFIFGVAKSADGVQRGADLWGASHAGAGHRFLAATRRTAPWPLFQREGRRPAAGIGTR